MDELLAVRVRAWIADDPDPIARAELSRLLDAGDEAELSDRFAAPLAFGTAGLRGSLRAGPNGMNRAVVHRAAGALAAHLGPGRTVVIGYDARHGSRRFALDTAAILGGAGLHARVLPQALPTPILAFAVRRLKADAGVMVTASHNPAGDNGYKVYVGGPGNEGAQLIGPADAEIEARMRSIGRVSELPRSEAFELLDAEIVDEYVEATAQLSKTSDRDVRVAYTPLHGVGRDTLLAVFARAGFDAAEVEPAQGEPDPGFPTVPFPNPEEPGVMDRVIALAHQTGAHIAVASDPDADRCAVAVGGRILRGDELGVLLADHVLAHRPGLVATTIVSSSMLSKLAAARGVPYAETLTGFKWIVRAGKDLAFGYEEALGYAVGPDVVRDKDGISAALLVAELAAGLRARGASLLDRLDELSREHGLHATDQYAVRVADPSRIAGAMRNLRMGPPRILGTRRVLRVRDLLLDEDDAGLPAADVVVLELDGGRVVVRPSGTEPKLKAYLETVVAVGRDPSAARIEASRRLEELRQGIASTLGL